MTTLPHVVQYRRRADGIKWIDMAAFDVKGPAEWYLGLQGGENSPWEYRLVDLSETPVVPSHTTSNGD